jgi:hypothetical protein
VNNTPIQSSRVVYNTVNWFSEKTPTWFSSSPNFSYLNGFLYKIIPFTSGYINHKIRGTIIDDTYNAGKLDFVMIAPRVNGAINSNTLENCAWYLRRTNGWTQLDTSHSGRACFIALNGEQNAEISFEIDVYRRIIGRQQIQFKSSWTERNIGCVKGEGACHISVNSTNDIDGLYIFLGSLSNFQNTSWSGIVDIEANK